MLWDTVAPVNAVQVLLSSYTCAAEPKRVKNEGGAVQKVEHPIAHIRSAVGHWGVLCSRITCNLWIPYQLECARLNDIIWKNRPF